MPVDISASSLAQAFMAANQANQALKQILGFQPKFFNTKAQVTGLQAPGFVYVLADETNNGASTLYFFDGTLLKQLTSATDISAAVAAASAAATSAATATSEAGIAIGAAATATTQAGNASASATNASGSASASATSATASAESASAAAGSVTAAIMQATDASESAAGAATSATSASESAAIATTEADAAAGSATSASGSAATATTQAGIATAQASTASAAATASESAYSAIANGTATNAGTLSGAEIAPVSRGAGLLQTTVATIAGFVLAIFTIAFASGAGAAVRTLLAKLLDYPITPFDFGAKGDGVTDDSGAINNMTGAAIALNLNCHFPGFVFAIGNYTQLWGKVTGVPRKSIISVLAGFNYSASPNSQWAVTNKHFSTSFNSATADEIYLHDLDFCSYQFGQGGKGIVAIANTKKSEIININSYTAPGNTQYHDSVFDIYACNSHLTMRKCYMLNATQSPTEGGGVWVRNNTANGALAANVSSDILIEDNHFATTSVDEALSVFGVGGLIQRVTVRKNKIEAVSQVTFTGAITTTQLTASNVVGSLVQGQTLTAGTLTGGTVLGTQVSGTPGGAGVYNITPSQTVTSTAMTAAILHNVLVSCFPLGPNETGGTAYAGVQDVTFDDNAIIDPYASYQVMRVGLGSDSAEVAQNIRVTNNKFYVSLATFNPASVILYNVPGTFVGDNSGNVASGNYFNCNGSPNQFGFALQGWPSVGPNNVTEQNQLSCAAVSCGKVFGNIFSAGTYGTRECNEVINNTIRISSAGGYGCYASTAGRFSVKANNITMVATSGAGLAVSYNGSSSISCGGDVVDNEISQLSTSTSALAVVQTGIGVVRVKNNYINGAAGSLTGTYAEVAGNSWNGVLDSVRSAAIINTNHNASTPLGTVAGISTPTSGTNTQQLGWVKVANTGASTDWQSVFANKVVS